LLSPQAPRLADPAFRAAVESFERGDFERARAQQLALAEGLDVELLGARLSAAQGDDIAAVRAIESLRGRFPGEGRVFATAAEIHAAAGRLTSAEDEIREGLALAGPTADLTRARGVLALCRQGGAPKGLEHLLEALDQVPDLEFTRRPLSQAHLLLGNAALAAENAPEAAGHAKAALLALPDELEAQRLLADALAALGEFDSALEAYEQLAKRGVEVRVALASLYARAATADLLATRKERALERWVRARELGATDEELGFGVNALEKAAAAQAALQKALRFAPQSLEALHMLGVVKYQSNDLDGAATCWRRAFELASASGEATVEPVHLHLARLHLQRGERERARDVLVSYLTQWPEGEFAASTRELLAQLER
jgi:tetratricopeptide (TPR) repeat protein